MKKKTKPKRKPRETKAQKREKLAKWWDEELQCAYDTVDSKNSGYFEELCKLLGL